jgi:hypothetical protein
MIEVRVGDKRVREYSFGGSVESRPPLIVKAT